MIATQTFCDIGCPNGWRLIGACVVDIEPTDAQGYGVSTKALFQAAEEEFNKDHAGMVLLNARFEIREGSAHPSYCRRRIRMVGDLYSPLPNGLKELPNHTTSTDPPENTERRVRIKK